MAVDALEYDDTAEDANPAGALEEILESPERLKDLELDAFAEELERQVTMETNFQYFVWLKTERSRRWIISVLNIEKFSFTGIHSPQQQTGLLISAPTIDFTTHHILIQLFNSTWLALLAYKSVHGLAPEYLSAYCVLVSHMPGRSHLRSADQWTMFVPRTKTVTVGPRGIFTVCALASETPCLCLFVTLICHWRISGGNWNFICLFRNFMYLGKPCKLFIFLFYYFTAPRAYVISN